jgi:aspartyl-tRNA synthetase
MCGALREEDIGKEVLLAGWVHRPRDLGGLIFCDLRDRFGITQIVIDPKKLPLGRKLGFEYVIAVRGKVSRRREENPALATGKIEVMAETLEILSESAPLPLSICDETVEVNDEVRLEYRFLDMRRGPILKNIIMRHKAMMATRDFLDSEGFIEVVTPMLGKSTPEGARDYLVPSRVYPGMFYALPQSPQMYKQILMIGNLDRYFQIATCFRDEDLRADRQPEFAQIDMEMSFATCEELFPIVERMTAAIFKKCRGVDLKTPFLRMTYADCMEYYGSDKPDLRFGMKLVRLDDLARQSSFSIFQTVLEEKGCVKGFSVKGGVDISRKAIDELTLFMQNLGGKGLLWMKYHDGALTSPISKFIPSEQHKAWIEKLGLEAGDAAFIIAGTQKKTNQLLDHLRRKLGRERHLIAKDSLAPLWVTDFPLFSYNDEEKRMESEHHPFTSPNFDDIDLLEREPLRVRSSSYDLVLNGYEMASGSQRIHDGHLQEKIFALLGLTPEERAQKFGFFIDALKFGTPPHIGIALGFDRVMMILCDTDSIRDVVAFPKTQKAQDLMTHAPSPVSEAQLKELKIRI